ncbi:hypothetical protein BU23DRAFT_559155 [Bimuria novae-zelandiae CBS 107.79]|uniref:Uncharacterized protein n=1 Tax=Bimuria novae-zelandiae CBS 107.79 TaxID=1447943 RepID=A0A6A5UR49_9PLEO|nr:hypothetical protein BU23DRAFT_559155 [Bimuria novae-zelandiae CBS 107.79]
MARRSRRLGTSRAVPAAVSTIATSRAKRRCRNNPPPSTAVPIYENPSSPATPLLDCGSSFVCEEDLEPVTHLTLDTDAGSPADAGTDRDSGIGLDVERDRERDPLASKAAAILERIAYYWKQGPAKPRHSNRTTELWQTESEFWKRYCLMVQEVTGLSLKD